MKVVEEGMCCTDCILLLANGECGDNAETEAVQACIAAFRPGVRSEYLVCTSTEETDVEFSWSPCECCGSRLGGSRHSFARLAEEGA